MTKLTHTDIINYSKKVIARPGSSWKCGAIFCDLTTRGIEIPDVMGFNSWSTTLIEAKVSRTDFLKDKKKPFRFDPSSGMGNWRFYACPKNLIKPNEIPKNWGLIYVNESGKCRIKVKPTWQQSDINSEKNYLYSIVRRLIYNKDNPQQLNEFFNKYL